jgi:hypothetical protein
MCVGFDIGPDMCRLNRHHVSYPNVYPHKTPVTERLRLRNEVRLCRLLVHARLAKLLMESGVAKNASNS